MNNVETAVNLASAERLPLARSNSELTTLDQIFHRLLYSCIDVGFLDFQLPTRLGWRQFLEISNKKCRQGFEHQTPKPENIFHPLPYSWLQFIPRKRGCPRMAIFGQPPSIQMSGNILIERENSWEKRLATGMSMTFIEKIETIKANQPVAEDIPLRPTLLRLCVRYLLAAKKGSLAFDRVSHFHISNGARIERINWAAQLITLTTSPTLKINSQNYTRAERERPHHPFAN